MIFFGELSTLRTSPPLAPVPSFGLLQSTGVVMCWASLNIIIIIRLGFVCPGLNTSEGRHSKAQ
jgi:hypothetical protein